MARLNEPPVSADSIDTLRRKLLRQNRDLAKANAIHLARIKNLEADYSRCLSDNIELNGRIIGLEKELENSNARRIADHALDIRSRLETQLMDCMSLIASLGQEPPTKRHASPRGRRISRASLSHRSPPQRRPPREPTKDTEARALQEGRLPPIAENKSYPRATLDREQILALCSEAADITDTTDTTDSPELGPPPLSRFVDTDSVNIGSPHRPLDAAGPETSHSSPMLSPSPAPAPQPAVAPKTTNKSDKAVIVRPDSIPTSEKVQTDTKRPPAEDHSLPPVMPQTTVKVGSKRKYSISDDTIKNSKPVAGLPKPKEPEGRPDAAREQPSGQTLKELANRRREARERMSAPLNPRKPLSAKSTNDDLTSPVKSAKAGADNGKAPEKPKPRAARERAAQKIKEEAEPESPVEVPAASPPPPAPVTEVFPSTETVPTEAALLSPASPEPTSRMSLSSVRDTPPPTDISSRGETSRPSRRARAAVSYAEPNLRDKMRRPTKELYDAVTGQTRYLQRSGSANAEQLFSEGVVVVKRESSEESTWKQISAAMSPSQDAARREKSPNSPANKAKPAEPMLTVVKPLRKKRSSSMMSGSISESEGQRPSQQPPSGASVSGKIIDSQPTPSPERQVDPYEFRTSITASDDSWAESKEDVAPARQSKSSRRLSSVVREDFKVDSTDGAERAKAGGPKKRASMVLPKRSHLEAESLEDSSFESVESGDFPDTRSKSSMRRRSMML
ncbi:shugoshin [Colletotrichum graminicola]|uniref:Shugoshin n=1 Tax=Colletotrichum graminicola (strain M1.001 / M2 / FGSC 10212) TaxID=645133 RepID=E3QRE1_COLGM|nr:shugoshin [Colletotrichum graminicola M1.001]EFQ33429.1 shugoshin [Colletotrichum graminicola M1.001]WDK09563.1 shugoshin [Colletotrichum graminicola]